MRRNILRFSTQLLFLAAASAHTPPPAAAPKAPDPPEINIAPPLPDKPQQTLEFSLGEGVGRGAHILIPITIAGKDHLFVVDTGSPGTALDTGLAQALKDTLGPPVGKTQITALYGRETELTFYHAPALDAQGQRLKSAGTIVALTDLESCREAEGRPVEGILGRDVLAPYVVRLDFRRHKLELIDPLGFQPPQDRTTKVFPMVTKGDAPEGRTGPCIAIPFAGVPGVPVAIDTGSERVGSITPALLQEIPVMQRGKATSHAVADAAGEAEAKEVRIERKWSIGDTSFEDLPLEIAAFNEIGLRTLADFVVTIDILHNRVYLESIRAQHPPELPDLEFGIALKDGRIIVHNLNGGAKALDIQPGDQILAVDGKDIAKTELWALREQLQKAKAPVVRLKRNDQTHEVTLHHEQPPPP